MPLRSVGDRFVLLDAGKPGGMAKVLRAMDTTTGSQCGIKALQTAHDPSSLNCLAMTRDIESLEALRHPHIVRLISHGRDDDLGVYLAMEWLEVDLKSACLKTPYLDWTTYWKQVGAPLLAALCYAYAKKRIHRDVKPANIMFNAEGDLKLIDFGISGVLEKTKLGATLKGHKSGAFSPPEDSPKDALRDVYGFAATAIYAFAPADFETREELLASFECLSAPDDVRRVLEGCLAADPDDRPDSVLELRELLARSTVTSGLTDEERHPTVYIKLSRSVEQLLREQDPPGSLGSTIRDLNELCFAENSARVVEHDSNRLVLVTAGRTYIVAVDTINPGVLVVVSARDTRPARWSYAQDRSMRVSLNFREGDRIGRVEQSQRNIEQLQDALSTHSGEQSGIGDQSVFEVWRAILRGRAEFYGRKYPAILASSLRPDGARIVATLIDAPDENLVGLSYFVDDGVAKVAAGEIESIQDNSVILYCSAPFDPKALRDGGWLRYNASGTERAIRHQELAIERVQSSECPNLDLAKFIGDPSLVPAPKPVDYSPIVPDIDQDKQQAVKAALGSQSIFLIVGPPGTGKTEFITELVLQELERKPDARILIAAQTHMAVDSAMSRVRQARPDVSCVRLGRPSDKIARGSLEFLIENLVQPWRDKVTRKCHEAVDAYGESRGVDVNILRYSRAAKRAVEEERAQTGCEVQNAEVLSELVQIREKTPQEQAQLASRIDALEDMILTLKEQLSNHELRVAEAKSELYKLGQPAIDVFEAILEGNTPAASTTDTEADQILAVVSGWLQRLSLSQELFPAILAESQVIGGTCLGFIGVPGTSEIEYDIAIIEEASRALPSEVLVPASRAHRVVLVGDGKQLPPFLESELQSVDWLEANSLTEAEVNETLFDRLELRLPDASVARLKLQYRMDKSIGDLVGNVFYPGLLRSAPGAGSKKISLIELGLEKNVLLVSTSREAKRSEEDLNPGYANPCEARVIRSLLRDLIKRTRKRQKKGFSIAVLAPYIGQTIAIENAIADLRGDAEGREIKIAVHTVHTFQGKQADIAIFSCVRTEGLGFTADPRLVNVAISRGQGGLIIVGDVRFLESNQSSDAYRQIVKHVRENTAACRLMEASDVQ